MPIKLETYVCQYCGKKFLGMTECEEHEATHIKSYKNASVSEIIKDLKNIRDSAYGYRIGNETMGIHTESFKSLMDTAVRKLYEMRWIPVTERLPKPYRAEVEEN